MTLQHGAPGTPGCTIGIKDRGEEGIKYLCLFSSLFVRQQTPSSDGPTAGVWRECKHGEPSCERGCIKLTREWGHLKSAQKAGPGLEPVAAGRCSCNGN